MKCPHCTVVVHLSKSDIVIGDAKDEDRNKTIRWHTTHAVCPHCNQLIIWLSKYSTVFNPNVGVLVDKLIKSYLVWPQSTERPIPTEVPAAISADFNEAARVLPISPQASAALTRRILQQVLRDYGKTKSKDLADQIDEIITQGHIPASLSEQLDAVRVIGNFAAHPLKSQLSGAILPVEDDEAEWNLDVLEAVFDHYFVKPAQAQARKDALNKKLVEAGKPLLP